MANINVINHHHNQGDYLAMTVDPNRPSTEALPTNDELQHKYDNPVIPPVEHRDDKNEKNGLGKKILAGVGALSVAAAGFFGVKAIGGEGESAPAPEKTPAATAPANPGQTPSTEVTTSTPEAVETSINPSTVLQGELYRSLTSEQRQLIDRIRSLSLDEFEALPQELRLMYGQFVYDTYEPYTKNQIKTQGDISLAELREPTSKITLDSSGQDILLDQGIKRSAVMWTVANEQPPYSYRPENVPDAQKMLALNFGRTEGPEYEAGLNAIDQAKVGLSTLGDDGYDISTAMAENNPNQAGEKRINVLYNGRTNQQVMQWVVFKDIKGAERGAWIEYINLAPEAENAWVDLP